MSRGERFLGLRAVLESFGPELVFWGLLLSLMVSVIACPGCVTPSDTRDAEASRQELERDARDAERRELVGEIDKAELERLLAAALERHQKRLEEIQGRVGERTESLVEHLTNPAQWITDLLAVGAGGYLLNRHRGKSREKQLAELREELAAGRPEGPRRTL